MHRQALGVRGTLLGALILALSACGGGTDVSEVPPPEETEGTVVERSRSEQVAADRRERERQRLAARGGQSDFVYARYEPDLTADQPQACLVFSQALDPAVDYSVYVDFDGDVSPAYKVEGQRLCLGGLSFASSYDATLREGLPSDDGALLGREETVSISFEDRPPFVGFSGSGIILPRTDADGLAVETVNVDAVRIKVSRVNDSVLAFKSLTKGQEASEGRYAYVYGDENPSDVSSEIWSGTMAIDSVRNAPVVTVFPIQDVIDTLQPGAYYVEISDTKELGRYDGPPASAKRWIMLTDLALTAYRSQSGLDITLRSLEDGRAMPNTKVQLIAFNNEVLGQSSTGVDGRVTFNPELLAGTGNLAPKIILATGLKGDTAVLDLTRAPVDLSELDTGGRMTPGDVDAYLYTERGIYRPGEKVHLTAMMRDRAGRAIDGRAGTLITFRPNGMEAARERFLTGEGGAIQRDIELARDAARGVWRTVIKMDGMTGNAGSVSYSVEDFIPQRIAVELDTEDAPFLPDDDVRTVDVDSRFLYGAPGAGLTVNSQVRIEPDPSPFETWDGYRWGAHTSYFNEQILRLDPQTTDGEGKATLRVAPGQRAAGAEIPLRLNAVVSVLEPGGRAVTESVRIPYRPNALYLGTKPDYDGRLGREDRGNFNVALVNARGEGVDQSFDWRIIAVDYHYDWYREGDRWRWRRSRTVRTVNEGRGETAEGFAQVPVSGLDWGEHELIVDAGDGLVASQDFYIGWGGSVSDDGVEAPDRVQVSVTEQNVVSGRPAAITIVPPYDGEAQIVVATDKVLSVETRQVSTEGTELTLAVNDDWGEGAYVMVNVYTQRDPVIQSRPRRAVGVTYVPV
ncbi:MAG: MG2 domain-containing protein, partial [Pseudomonadota bacterium]